MVFCQILVSKLDGERGSQFKNYIGMLKLGEDGENWGLMGLVCGIFTNSPPVPNRLEYLYSAIHVLFNW